MMKILPFQKKTSPQIDWDAAEIERLAVYPKIPKRALKILKMILERRPGSSEEYLMKLDRKEDGYPPDIPVTPCGTGVVWILDLLDRYGGEVAFGNTRCIIRRKKKRPPLILIRSISQGEYAALNASYNFEYEHLLRSKRWQLLGKDLPGVELLGALISGREETERLYFGLFDQTTFRLLIRRMHDGLSMEDLIASATQL